MMMPHQVEDFAYAAQREAEERVAAAVATDPAVREAHFMLAERYADRAWSLAEREESAP